MASRPRLVAAAATTRSRYNYSALQCGAQPRCRRKSLSTLSTTKPIVIVGGGPTGLLLSVLLSEYGVPSVVLDGQTVHDRFRHPQAHFLNTRTMEIFKHGLPATYQSIEKVMPPVEHWQSFRFGASMVQSPPLARVLHPVNRPLQAGRDANGVLQEEHQTTTSSSSSNERTVDLSPCTVGHLAQHTFGRILYATALQSECCRVHYNTIVETMEQANNNLIRVRTTNQQVFETDICVAADGAHSTIRKQSNIGQTGKEGLQHLINIHVQLPADQAENLHNDGNTRNYAMLYSVFTPEVVAMVVCHSVGEYIIQIPYFPPYQTVEDDFGPDRASAILRAIFGGNVDCKVLSVKPWTMSSFIADQYHHHIGSNESSGVVLVGDAAHVFPPAGGFGMNTGLQDVHNLAWKLAAYRTQAIDGNSEQEDETKRSLGRFLRSYENERRPIAQQNAALSVRNYQRLLEVTKSLYLNDQHPALLKSVLDYSPLPIAMRKTIFRSLLKTALYPLSWLHDETNIYTQHIRTNLRRILATGVGLPLLFPKFEIGFSYGSKLEGASCDDRLADTMPVRPHLEVGRLVPHVYVNVLDDSGLHFPRLQYFDSRKTTISTTDLPAQMRRDIRPTFVLLWVQTQSFDLEETDVLNLVHNLSEKLGLPVEFAKIWVSGKDETELSHTSSTTFFPLVLSELSDLTPTPHSFSFARFHDGLSYVVLIRPDGHVSGIVTNIDDNSQKGLCRGVADFMV